MLRSVSRSFSKMIVQRRNLMGISQVELAKLLKISQMTVSKLERNLVRIDSEKLVELCNLLKLKIEDSDPTNEDVNWDEYEKKQYLKNQGVELNPKDQSDEDKNRNYRLVPEYNVRVSAGHGEFQGLEEVKQTLQMPSIFMPENGHVGFVRVEGDSMFPTINNGDYVAVEFESGYTADGLYLIRIEDTCFVKRLQREFKGIRIISDNPQYKEMSVMEEDGQNFGLIGRVALVIRKT